MGLVIKKEGFGETLKLFSELSSQHVFVCLCAYINITNEPNKLDLSLFYKEINILKASSFTPTVRVNS